MIEHNQPNPIEFAAHVVSRSGSMTYHGGTQQVSVRLHTHNFLHLQAMAEASGLPRSEMINHALEAGIFAIREQLSEEAREKFDVQLRRVTGELFEESQKGAEQ